MRDPYELAEYLISKGLYNSEDRDSLVEKIQNRRRDSSHKNEVEYMSNKASNARKDE